LVSIAGATACNVAVAVLPVPPVASLTVTELFIVATMLGVALTLNVQLVPAGRLPVKVTEVAPEFAPTIPVAPPVHEPETPGELESARPAGNVSVNVTAVRAVAAFGLETVKPTAVVPPTGTTAGLKLLVTTGANANTLLASTAPKNRNVVIFNEVSPFKCAQHRGFRLALPGHVYDA